MITPKSTNKAINKTETIIDLTADSTIRKY